MLTKTLEFESYSIFLFSLGLGKTDSTINYADMDKFYWYALNDNVMGGVSNGNVTQVQLLRSVNFKVLHLYSSSVY